MAAGEIKVKVKSAGLGMIAKQLEAFADGCKQIADRLKDLQENHCEDCGERLEWDSQSQDTTLDGKQAVFICPKCGERYVKRNPHDHTDAMGGDK